MSADHVAAWRYAALTSLVTIVSVGVVVYAALAPSATEHGGRGGAVGTVVSLVVLWTRPNLGGRLLTLVEEAQAAVRERRRTGVRRDADAPASSDDAPTLEETADRVLALETAFKNSAASERQNVFWLGLATSIGTLFWGFGDLMAEALRAWLEAAELIEADLRHAG